jgi:hypothetical protein
MSDRNKSLAKGLKVDWWNAPNPYEGGSFAANGRAIRNTCAANYCAARRLRPSNFRLECDDERR